MLPRAELDFWQKEPSQTRFADRKTFVQIKQHILRCLG